MTDPMPEVTRALEARQDASDCARKMAEDGFYEPAQTILNALALLDSTVIKLERTLTATQDEMAALRKDAERYRFIKDYRHGKLVAGLSMADAENWDRIIDAALGEKND